MLALISDILLLFPVRRGVLLEDCKALATRIEGGRQVTLMVI